MPPPAVSCNSDFIKAPLTIRYIFPSWSFLPLVKITRTREFRRSCLSFLFTRKRATYTRWREDKKRKKEEPSLPAAFYHRVFTINRCFSKSSDVGYRDVCEPSSRSCELDACYYSTVGTIIDIVAYTCIRGSATPIDRPELAIKLASPWQFRHFSRELYFT